MEATSTVSLDPVKQLVDLLPEAWKPYVILGLIIAYVVTKWRSSSKTAELHQTVDNLKTALVSISDCRTEMKNFIERLSKEGASSEKKETAIRFKDEMSRRLNSAASPSDLVAAQIDQLVECKHMQPAPTTRKKRALKKIHEIVDTVF